MRGTYNDNTNICLSWLTQFRLSCVGRYSPSVVVFTVSWAGKGRTKTPSSLASHRVITPNVLWNEQIARLNIRDRKKWLATCTSNSRATAATCRTLKKTRLDRRTETRALERRLPTCKRRTPGVMSSQHARKWERLGNRLSLVTIIH
jgi:hypothetical protein